MKGFRNFLVHIYGGIADKVAFEVQKRRIGRFLRIYRGARGFLYEDRLVLITSTWRGEKKLSV
jgi:uncharacterized protein YutE (UPF0331/DUF86 family)